MVYLRGFVIPDPLVLIDSLPPLKIINSVANPDGKELKNMVPKEFRY